MCKPTEYRTIGVLYRYVIIENIIYNYDVHPILVITAIHRKTNRTTTQAYIMLWYNSEVYLSLPRRFVFASSTRVVGRSATAVIVMLAPPLPARRAL